MSETKESIATAVQESMLEVAALMEVSLVHDISGDTVLLETGLDSLAFAMLVASLEERLGYDPFVISDAANYPTTVDQFVDFYVENQK